MQPIQGKGRGRVDRRGYGRDGGWGRGRDGKQGRDYDGEGGRGTPKPTFPPLSHTLILFFTR